MAASVNHVMQAAENPDQLLLETFLHAKNVKKDGEPQLSGFTWPVSSKDRQLTCQGLLRNLPLTDKLS
jgi:hypothetical protein